MASSKRVAGGAAGTGELLYHLPGGVWNPRRKPVGAGAVCTPLPDWFPPLSCEVECWLVTAILVEMGKHYGVNLNTSHSFEHRVGDPGRPSVH
jgi:hypothetical protein